MSNLKKNYRVLENMSIFGATVYVYVYSASHSH